MPRLKKFSWPSYDQLNGADYDLAYVLVHWAVLTKRLSDGCYIWLSFEMWTFALVFFIALGKQK